MKPLRKLIGVLIFVFAALPLGLGGLALLSTRTLVAGPEVYMKILDDERTDSLIQTIEAPSEESRPLRIEGYELDSAAVFSAAKQILPPRLVIDTLKTNVDIFFTQAANPPQDNVLAVFDLGELRTQLINESGTAVRLYLEQSKELPAELINELATQVPPAVLQDIKNDPLKYETQIAAVLQAKLKEMPATLPFKLPADVPAGSVNLASIQKSHLKGSYISSLTALALLLAAAFIMKNRWPERAVQLGNFLMVPGFIILLGGVIPYLINPTGLIRQMPELPFLVPQLISWLKFAGQTLMRPFLITGGVTVVIASGLQAFRFIPSHEEEQD
ncbi:MAG: hypothetical protein KKI09_11855 [Spirochaetes bacterium]|nr:hypothetical protein [Spirochaetota bacterium]MBU0956114.1 hypothetical protein [Spirochaetota bacterium]